MDLHCSNSLRMSTWTTFR